MDNSSAIMALLYGRPKRRKTSSLLAAFPNALCIGVRSAIELVGQNCLGFTPTVYGYNADGTKYADEPRTLVDLWEVLSSLKTQGHLDAFDAVIVDDGSLLCKASMVHWRATAPRGKRGKPDGFYPYQQLADYLVTLADFMRHSGCHLAMSFHERAPRFDRETGVFQAIGGPDIPQQSQVESVPGWCDLVARVVLDDAYPDPWLPTSFYVNVANQHWVTGDRTGICSEVTPSSLREILRASQTGYRLSRVAGLEWQDEVADKLVDLLKDQTLSIDPVKAAVSVARKQYPHYHPLHFRWACQDGIARAHFAQRGDSLFDFTQKSSGGSAGRAPPPLPPAPPPSG